MEQVHDHDRGLTFDLVTMNRRRALTLLGGAGLVFVAGCGSDGDDTSAARPRPRPPRAIQPRRPGRTPPPAPTARWCPKRRPGPSPATAPTGPTCSPRTASSAVTSARASARRARVAEGIPLLVNLTILDTTNDCAALAGAAVYVWHCDRDGGYSLYSEGVEDENYLRGLQETDANGRVTFESIFPAAYSGRYPHIHFEVYESVDAATSGGTRVATSQLALPEDICNEVYASEGYEQSVENLSQVSLESDNVFGDDAGASQLASASGDVDAGYTFEQAVPVDPTATSTGGSGGGAGGGPPGGPGGPPPGG